MKVKELLEELKGQYASYEIYELFSKNKGFHTDNLKDCVDNTDLEVIGYERVDEEEYDKSVLANACETADFESWFGDKDAKVLLVAVEIR